MTGQLIVILGGARSGKSKYAQELVMGRGGKVLFVATATASDNEMRKRIAEHQSKRPSDWLTLEAPTHVGEAISAALPADWILLDCVTLLAGNILLSLNDSSNPEDFQDRLMAEIEDLMLVITRSQASVVIVSNEVGLGLVPPYPLGRVYRDGLGRANQLLASRADTVVLMVAGIPLAVKGILPK